MVHDEVSGLPSKRCLTWDLGILLYSAVRAWLTSDPGQHASIDDLRAPCGCATQHCTCATDEMSNPTERHSLDHLAQFEALRRQSLADGERGA